MSRRRAARDPGKSALTHQRSGSCSGAQKTNPARFTQAGLAVKNEFESGLFASGDGQHLTALIITAGWAGHVTGNGCAALRAGFESWGAPAVRSLTEALTAFGLSAFWIGHVLKGVAISIDRVHSKLRGLHQAFQEALMTQDSQNDLRQDNRADQRYHFRSAGSSEG